MLLSCRAVNAPCQRELALSYKDIRKPDISRPITGTYSAEFAGSSPESHVTAAQLT